MQTEISVRTTRSLSSLNVHVSYASIKCLTKYFVYRGPVLSNALPVLIKECGTLDMFKTNLRCFTKNKLSCTSNVCCDILFNVDCICLLFL